MGGFCITKTAPKSPAENQALNRPKSRPVPAVKKPVGKAPAKTTSQRRAPKIAKKNLDETG
jgi:hypothetical protein